MRPSVSWLSALAFLLPAAAPRSAAPPASPPLVFDGVTVIDVQQGHRLPAQRVVIVGNRIQAVGSARTVPLPVGAQVVDARGKYLIPGLWDMHVHPNRATDAFYPLFVANGVTGIRDASSIVPLDTLNLLRREILAGTRVGPPRQFLSGQAVTEEKYCSRDRPQLACIATEADARRVVDSLKAAGADFIKTRDLDRAMYFAVIAEARRIGIPFGGHLTAAPAAEASDSGATFLDHLNNAGGLDKLCWSATASVARCQPSAERLRHNGTWVVPTIVTEFFLMQMVVHINAPVLSDVSPAAQAIGNRVMQFGSEFLAGQPWQLNWLRPSAGGAPPAPLSARSTAGGTGSLRMAQDVGVRFLAGTDVAPDFGTAIPGFSLHAELAIYVAQGLTPLEALQTATLNPAMALHGTDSLGTVAPGKLADLVLLDADPLQDITNITLIRAVVANGRYFDRPTLDRLVAEAQAKLKH